MGGLNHAKLGNGCILFKQPDLTYFFCPDPYIINFVILLSFSEDLFVLFAY